MIESFYSNLGLKVRIISPKDFSSSPVRKLNNHVVGDNTK